MSKFSFFFKEVTQPLLQSSFITQYNPKLKCWGMIGKYSISLFNESKTYFWLFCVCSKNTAVHNYNIKSELKFLKINLSVLGGKTYVVPSSYALTSEAGRAAVTLWPWIHHVFDFELPFFFRYSKNLYGRNISHVKFCDPMSRCSTSKI